MHDRFIVNNQQQINAASGQDVSLLCWRSSNSDHIDRMAEITSTTKDIDPRLSTHYRKIELQSHADLTFLQQNLAKAARARLDLHFPTAAALKASAPAEIINLGQNIEDDSPPEDEDAMRARVRMLVDEFLGGTFQQAAHNISVNGIDATALAATNLPSCSNPEPSTDNAEPADREHEVEGIHYTYAAFDPALQKKLASLHGELETLTAQVSKLRRDAPKNAAEAYKKELEDALLADEERWLAEKEALAVDTASGMQLKPVRDKWNQDAAEMFSLGVTNLAALSGVSKRDGDQQNSSLTETMGKMRRAATVAQEFE